MASEVKLPESALEEKKASPEVINIQAINNFVGTQNIKEQLGIKSSVVDENTVNEDVDLVKEEIPSVEPSQDVTEKPETLEEELKELQEEQKCEEAPSPIVETINGETENGVHSNQFTEELPPEVVRADEIPANGTSSSSEEIQQKSDSELLNVRKIDSEEVPKEDAPQSQIPENAEADKDVSPGDTTTLSDKDCHKEAEIPVGDAKLTEEVEIPSTMTPPVTEEVSAEAEVKKEILEEVEQEQVHQTEVAKENLAEEKECQDETEDESRGASETLTAEETIPEEASRENQAPEMISEETAKNEETSAKAEMDETGPTDSEETTPHEDSKSYDSPITNEESRKGNEESEDLSEEVKETDVPVTATPLISEEDKGSEEINEETKEEAQQDQIAEGDEIDKEASQSTPVTDLSESEHQDETEKEVENACVDPEEQIIEKVDLKEVESASVSEDVSEVAKENVTEELQNEQAADENCVEEECPPDAGIQNTDAAELVVPEETMPEEAISESKTLNPEMQISEEVVPTEDSIGVTEKDETSENVEEDATEVSGKPDESALETTVSRDVTPEIEITDAEKTVTAETDNMDIKEIENEDEAKNSEEVEPSESSPESIQIEEATPNDCEEEKEGDDNIENIETNHEQEIESCLETEEQLEESKPSTSEEELSSERETMETKPIEEKADEENVAQDEITLDSKEAFGNDDEAANCDEKGDETREINLAEEHNTNNGINEDEEANEENLEERSEPTKPSDNTEDSSTAELPREEIQLETEIDVPSELAKSEEVLPETPSEGTVLSEMENIEHKVHDSERDDTEAGSSYETYELKEDEKSNTNDPGEMVQDFGVDEKPEEILPGNTVNETTPSIQNEEDPPEKDENINNEIAEEEHITEVEASTVATEVPAEEVQSSIDERSYKLDQSIPETASEQDNLPIASVGSEIETEKPEIGDASSQGEAADSVIPETDDKSELVVEPKEKTDEEVTQKVEEVEEPCIISHDKEEIAELIKPSDNTEESTSAELPKEEIQLETETDVSSELAKSVEVLPETPSEGTVLSDMETEKIEEKVNDSERDDTEAGNLHETNELKEDEKSNTNEPDETVQNFEVSEKPAEILLGNIEHETTPSIQNAEDPPEKDESITNETTEEEHIIEVEASTVVTEVPAEEVQSSIDQRSYELDQSIPETASEQDILPIASVGSETEAEKPEIGDASSQEVTDSVIPETDDKSELEVEPQEKTEEEVTQKVEEVEEPCTISHDKEELPEKESTIVHEETSIEPSISTTIQQDQQTEESDANLIEGHNATHDISVDGGSEATTTLISSVEQTDERSIDKEGTTTIKEENNVEATNEEAKIAEKLEESTEQIDQCTDPSNVAEVELSQTETVATETEILEVTPSEKLEEESNPTDIDAESAELEDTAEKSTEQEEVSSEPSNAREWQIDQTEITAEQDQPSEESEVKPTEPDQATEDVLTVENSEVDATVSESVSEIQDQPSEESEVKPTELDQAPEDVPTVANSEVDATVSESVSEVENSEVIVQSGASVEQIEDAVVDKEKSVVLQEEDAVVPEEEGQVIEAENVKHVEELPEKAESTIVPEETSIEPNINTVQQDQETEESDANLIEAHNATDDISVEEGSEATTTLVSSAEQNDERSIDKEGAATIQEENNVEATNEVAKIPKELDESTEQVDQCSDPSNVAEVQLSQTETVAPETEILEVTPSEKLEEENNPTDIDAESAELEDTAEKSTEQEEVSSEPSNAREWQIDQTEITAEQDQPSEESEVKPTEPDQATEDVLTVENSEVDATVSESVSAVENSEVIGESGASVEQIEDVSVDKEESVVLQEEDAAVPEEEGQKIEAENEKHIEEDPQITTPSEVNQNETVSPETENLEVVSNEVLGDENKLASTGIKLAESESAIEEPSEEKEIPTEPSNTRELQVDQAEIVAEQDQPSEESEMKPTELDQAIEEVPTMENSEVDTIVSESVEEIGETSVAEESVLIQEEGAAVEIPEEEAANEKQIEEEVPQITDPSEVSEVELNQSEPVPAETEILKTDKNEALGGENKLAGTDINLAKSESTMEVPTEEKEIPTELGSTRELQTDENEIEIIAEQDQLGQESDIKPSESDLATNELSPSENSEVVAAVSEREEGIGEDSAKEECVILQEDNVAVKMPQEEAGTKNQIEEEVPQITDPSDVTEVELNQIETVFPPETETLEAASNEELGDENKLAGADIKLAEFDSTREEPSEEKEIPTEPNNTRELQVDQAEIIAEQDQPSEESEIKPIESDQAIEEVPTIVNSEVDAAVSETVQEIGETSVAKEESVILQEEGVAVEMPEDEVVNKKQIEEEVPQIMNPNEITQVELSQSETVPAETETVEADSNEELGDENKLAGTNLVESEDTVEVPTEEKEVPTEFSNTRELQIDQSEIVAEQDEPSQESFDVKPAEPDQATEEAFVAEKSDIVDATVTATVEESKEEIVFFEEENVAVEMPVEGATNEKLIKPEVTEVVYPSEITAEHPADTETEIVGDERGLAATELKSDQMENYLPEGLTEEKLDAGVSSGVEEIHEKSEVSEVLSESTGEQVEGEETDAGMIKEETDQGIAAAEEEEPCEKHIEGEIDRTADPEIDDAAEEELKPELTEKEVDPQILEPQAESPEQEKATEELASVEEKPEAGTTLVSGETQTEETESGILPESVAESVTVPEEKISQEIEKNKEEIPTTADSEICDSSNTISNEKELDPLIHETQTESPEQERETEESALLVENSVATAPSVPDEGQIEEIEIANKEDDLLVQTMPESVVQPEETISQEVEANEEFSDKHIAGEILRTVDPAEISDTAEESKVILTEEDADSQKLGTETELPEQEETTEESTLIEEKSDATASLPPGDEHQSTAESVAVPEEGISQEAEAETIEESSAQNVTGVSTIISNEEEVHSDKLITEIESPDPVRAAQELAEEKSTDSGNVIPGEGQVEEREIANKESCVAPENECTIESVTVPEERVPQGIETDDEPSDKHIVGEEDKAEQAQITASPVEQPDSENSGTELESALVEKTNDETDAKANIDEAGSTSFAGAVINQTDNEPETVPVVEQMHAKDEEAKGHTERDIDATEFLKMPEIVVDETNEQTEDAVPNISEQNKEVEEEANQSEEPEQGFASIVSSFLINKVLSEENQKIDDGTEQNNAASVIPKTSDDETIQEVTTTRNEPETRDEDILHATNSTEDLKLAQEQEEDSAVKEVKEDGVEQDYLPVSRFLMDKILRQEETKYPGEEEKTEEPDKHVISDGGIQVQEDLEENSTLVVAPPEKNAEPPSSYPETGKTLIGEVGNTSIGDGAISSEEKIEETTSVEELPKQGEGNLSPEEVAGDLEKEEKPADEALEHIEDENKSLVSDVAEQEGERSISPGEATRDFDKEDTGIEQKNEGIPSEDKVEEITGEVAVPMQVGDVQHKKPAEEKDETLDSKVTSFTEEVEDLVCGENSKDLVVEETVVNAPEISTPEKTMEENETAVVMQKEDEHKDEAVSGEETPKDVKNVEENYVFVEHEVNQPEETKEVLEEKVTDEVSDAAILNLEEKQTTLSAEIDDENKSLVGQVEVVKRDMADSTENCPKVEQSLPDVPEVPMVTEIVKEHAGNEAEFIHGEEEVKEVTGTVESFENKSQEKASEKEAAKMEKKSEEIKDDEQEEDEEEEEEGSHREREAEITGGDPTVKSEAKETEMNKSAQKKSLNILSGVGLKVITFTKVKKAFTGKSFTKVKKAFTGKSKSSSPSAK